MSVTTRTTPRPDCNRWHPDGPYGAQWCHDYHAPPVRTPNDSAILRGTLRRARLRRPDRPTRR